MHIGAFYFVFKSYAANRRDTSADRFFLWISVQQSIGSWRILRLLLFVFKAFDIFIKRSYVTGSARTGASIAQPEAYRCKNWLKPVGKSGPAHATLGVHAASA